MDIMDLIKLKIQLERFTASKLQEAKNYVRQNGIIAWATEEGDGAEDDDRHLVYALVFRQTGTYYRIGRSGVLAPAAWAAYAATVSFMTWTKRIIYIGDFDGDEDDQNFQDTMDEAYGEWATMAVEPYDLEGAQYLDEDTWNEIYEKFTAETDQANWKLEQMRMSHQLKQLNMEYHNITAEDPFAVIQKGHMIFWENNSFIIPDGMMIVTHLQHAFEARVGEQYLLAIPAYTTNEWGISLAIKNLFKAAKVFAVIPKKIVVAYDRHEEYEWSDPWPELWQINETLKDFNNKYTAIKYNSSRREPGRSSNKNRKHRRYHTSV